MNHIHAQTNAALEHKAYVENLRLSEAEYALGHIYLHSRPRCMGIVLGNGCNIYCPHCYQVKNGDNLLRSAEIASELRREFIGLYPYLSMLRIQGGEVFALPGFRELLDDVDATVSRPIISISTNGTLIDESWAERIVRTPFHSVTVSIDGGTSDTFARLRRGADLDSVLANIRRIETWKHRLGSELPALDSFFVIMRSNFREIPQYLDLMRTNGILDVAFQTMLADDRNLSREPALVDELFVDPLEVRELHAILRQSLARERERFKIIKLSGLRSLFERHGLDYTFLLEETCGLHPDTNRTPANAAEDGDAETTHLCPNPWTTLFVAENGDVSLCFLSEPVGNLYETPLSGIWNCPKALSKRSMMASGRHLASGCSPLWCSWREGSRPSEPGADKTKVMLAEITSLRERASSGHSREEEPAAASTLGAVRRLLISRNRRVAELESMFADLCEKNADLHQEGQRHIDHLESRIRDLEADRRRREDELGPLVRAVHRFHASALVKVVKRTIGVYRKFKAKFPPVIRGTPL